MIGLLSCNKKYASLYDDGLLGYWINPVSVQNTVYTYDRVKKFDKNAYGFAFFADNVFVERKNAGWCGTPPITYKNFNGSWNRQDSIINISVKFWGGINKIKWKIKSLDKDKLTIEVIKVEQVKQ